CPRSVSATPSYRPSRCGSSGSRSSTSTTTLSISRVSCSGTSSRASPTSSSNRRLETSTTDQENHAERGGTPATRVPPRSGCGGGYFLNAPTGVKRWSANTEAALRTPSQVRPSVSTSRRSLVPLVSLSGPDVPMIGSPPRTPPVEPPPSTMTPWAWPWSVPWPPFSPAVRPNSVVVSSDTNGRSSAPRSWKNALSAPAASFAWSCSWPFELVWVSNPPMSTLTNRSPTLALTSWAAVLNACASPVSGYGEAGWYSLLLSVLIVLIAFSVSSAVVATGSLYWV